MKLINQFWYIWDVFNQIVFSSNRILWILIEIFKSNWSKCNSQHQQQQQPKTDWFDWNNIIYHISYRVTIITVQCIAMQRLMRFFHSILFILPSFENVKTWNTFTKTLHRAKHRSFHIQMMLSYNTLLHCKVMFCSQSAGEWICSFRFLMPKSEFFNAKIWVF